MPSNNIAFARKYTSVIDEVYQRASVSGVLNSGRRMVRAGHNAKFYPAFVTPNIGAQPWQAADGWLSNGSEVGDNSGHLS